MSILGPDIGRFPRRAARLLAIAAAVAPLAACALVNAGGGPAPQFFTLTAAHPAATNAETASPITVDEFSAPAAIDTARIVRQSSANEIAYYAGARWADRAPRMIQNLTVETLENSGRFRAVSAQGAGLRADYELMGDIRRFAAVPSEDGGRDLVRVDVLVRLVRADERTLVASKPFSASVVADGGGIRPIVSAYDAALREVLDGIAVWASEEMTRDAAVAGR